jgi:hypothetical protein
MSYNITVSAIHHTTVVFIFVTAFGRTALNVRICRNNQQRQYIAVFVGAA